MSEPRTSKRRSNGGYVRESPILSKIGKDGCDWCRVEIEMFRLSSRNIRPARAALAAVRPN
jgi:hypothetical protein